MHDEGLLPAALARAWQIKIPISELKPKIPLRKWCLAVISPELFGSKSTRLGLTSICNMAHDHAETGLRDR